MGIPQRVQDAAAEADKQLQALVNAPPAANEGPAAVVPPAAPPAAPVAPSDPAPPATVQPTSTEAELVRLQQQLNTEAGRNAARDAENAELRGRLAAMQEVITAQQRQQPAAPAAPATPAPSLITDDDRKDFGEDMIDFVQRVFRQTLGNSLSQIAGRLTALENTLRQTTQQAATAARSAEDLAFEKYIGNLDGLAPGWKETNDDPAFVDWLKNRDTFSRKTRHELLAAAHAEADADTVAEFFRAYWKEKGIAPAQPAPTAPPSSPPATPTVDPQTLVAPAASNAPSPAANPRGGKIWTQAEIEKVYDDRMKKRIGAEDFARLELEIEAAVLEGRVQ
jgi:hypothetical protein